MADKKLYRLIFVKRTDGVLDETIIKDGISHEEATALQDATIDKNKALSQELTTELRTLEESPDSAEKRGQIKAVQNKLADLHYPGKLCTFAIQRDRASELAARGPK